MKTSERTKKLIRTAAEKKVLRQLLGLKTKPRPVACGDTCLNVGCVECFAYPDSCTGYRGLCTNQYCSAERCTAADLPRAVANIRSRC